MSAHLSLFEDLEKTVYDVICDICAFFCEGMVNIYSHFPKKISKIANITNIRLFTCK